MSLVAIPGLETKLAGVITYWRLSGPTNLAHLIRRLEDNSVVGAPNPTSVETAARRAARSLKRPGRLVLSTPGQKGWTIADGARVDLAVLTHRIECHVTGDTWLRIEPKDHPWAPEITAEFERQMRELQPSDISVWLVEQAEKHDAVGLRDTGGFYFIPAHRAEAWRRLIRAVHTASAHKLFEIPAVHSEQVVDAVTDAVTNEALDLAKQMEEQLQGGELGKRALETRQELANEALAKIRRYEELLGRQLDTVRARVEAVQAEVVAGILSFEEDEGNAP